MTDNQRIEATCMALMICIQALMEGSPAAREALQRRIKTFETVSLVTDMTDEQIECIRLLMEATAAV